MASCNICGCALNVSPLSKDCGGDCLQCMADAGDPDCIKEVADFNAIPDFSAGLTVTSWAITGGFWWRITARTPDIVQREIDNLASGLGTKHSQFDVPHEILSGPLAGWYQSTGSTYDG